jgi:hypothetical protein|tara:strand:+ start:840 stop:1139 length:300 start_codon:yes stop_codon:yes gene_type:complete
MIEEKIRLIRLTSGEEILCELHEQRNRKITVVKDPILLIPNEGQIGFMPYLPYTEIGIFGLTIKEEHIMFNVQPTDEMIDKYNSMTSAVVTPPMQKIVT